MQIDGRKIRDKAVGDLKEEVFVMNVEPHLEIVTLGYSKVTDSYLRIKTKYAEQVGISVNISRLDEFLTTAELESFLLHKLRDIKNTDALVVQLPLPPQIDAVRILGSIPELRDVDVLNEETYKKWLLGESVYMPPVLGAVLECLNYTGIDLPGKKIVVVGRGKLVGRPVFDYFVKQGYEVESIDVDSKNSSNLIKGADVIVAGTGVPGLIKPEMIKDGVVLIDAGTSEVNDKVVGDIDVDCYEKSSFYTPVPGGIGPVTISVLLTNVVKLIKINGTDL